MTLNCPLQFENLPSKANIGFIRKIGKINSGNEVKYYLKYLGWYVIVLVLFVKVLFV